MAERVHVLFGQSYFLRFDPKLWQAMQPYPPLGCLIAAACVRQHGYAVQVFDAMLAESEHDWEDCLKQYQPRFAVLYEDNFNYLSKMCLLRMRQAAWAMIAAARRLGCTVIVCGSDASDHPEDYLDYGADFVLVGEGEATLIELLESLEGRSGVAVTDISDISNILGLAFRDAAGSLVRTPRRPVLTDLDALPLPSWELIEIDRYRSVWRQKHGYFSINMVTTRGCPYHCNWCAKPIWGQTYHSRSPQHVVAEMRILTERYQPDHIWFADDIMGLKPGWLAQFADELEQQNLHIPFKCLSRVDLLLRDGEIDALQRAGAQIVWVGAESGSQKILDAMDKGSRVEQIYEAAQRLHQAGIQVGFFLQFGYPGEERDDIEKTVQMVRDCQPDEIGMSVSYPLPGTKFYDLVKQELGGKQNWLDSEDLDMLYQGPFSTAFYRQLYSVLHKEFRARRSGRELLRVLRRPQHLRLRHLRQAATMSYQALTLPLSRLRLQQLAKPSGTVGLVSSGMSAQAAAQPTRQSGQPSER